MTGEDVAKDAIRTEGVAGGTPVSVSIHDDQVAAPAPEAGAALVEYSKRISNNATNTPTATDAHISCIVIAPEVGGTTSSITIQDKSGTPLKLVDGLSTASVGTTPTILNFQTPIKMSGGFDIITAGAVAATVDIWVNYYQ